MNFQFHNSRRLLFVSFFNSLWVFAFLNVRVGCLLAIASCSMATAADFTLVAGNGTKGYEGDGGAALKARLNLIEAVYAAPGGFLYISDTDNSVIRRVSPNGQIDTVATFGASLRSPGGCAMDREANLYVADRGSNAVWRIEPSGRCERFAGVENGSAGYSGEGGPANAAQLSSPSSVAIGPGGDVFIADTDNHRIRRVALSTGIITTAAGNGTPGSNGDGGQSFNASLNSPWGLAIDSKGGLFVSEWNGHRIRYVAPNGIINTRAGVGIAGFEGDAGPATMARLSGPRSLALDTLGTLYVADHWNQRVRTISPAGTISSLFGTDPVLSMASGVTVDAAGNLLIADSWNFRVISVKHADSAAGTFCGSEFPTSPFSAMPGDRAPRTILVEQAHDFDGATSFGFPRQVIGGGALHWTVDLEGLHAAPLSAVDGVLVWHPCNAWVSYSSIEVSKLETFVKEDGGGLILIGSLSQWESNVEVSKQGPFPLNSVAAGFGLKIDKIGDVNRRRKAAAGSSMTVPDFGTKLASLFPDALDGITLSAKAHPEFIVPGQKPNGQPLMVGLSHGNGRVLAFAVSPQELVKRCATDKLMSSTLGTALMWASDRHRSQPSPKPDAILQPSRETKRERFVFRSSRLLSDAKAREIEDRFVSCHQSMLSVFRAPMDLGAKQIGVQFVQASGGYTGGDVITKGSAETSLGFYNTASHELGHQWHSHCGFPGAMQEGWGNFSSMVGAPPQFASFYKEFWKGELESLLTADPKLDKLDVSQRYTGPHTGSIESDFNYPRYRKACYIFLELKKKHGTEYLPRFLNLCAAKAAANGGDVALSMADFITLLSEATGEDLAPWFRQLGTTF